MSKLQILSVVNGYHLIKKNNFYYILDKKGMTIPYLNMSGTKEQVINELKRWKDKVDCNNEFMLKIENKFIEILENI